MENITNSNQAAGSSNPNFNPQFSGMPTKHSLLSAQADLNTNSFNRNPIPDNLPHTTVASPSSNPNPVVAKASSVVFDSPAPTPVTPKPALSTAPSPLYQAPAPVQPKPVPPVYNAAPTYSNPVGQTMNKPINPPIKPNPTIQAYSPNFVHPAPSNIPSGSNISGNGMSANSHDVVFSDSTEETTAPAPTHAKRHLVILIVSTLLIVALLGGGFYYWYFFMSGKATLNGAMAPGANNSADQAGTVPVKPQPANNPAPVVANPVKTQPTSPMKNTATPAVNSSAFGAAATTPTPTKTVKPSNNTSAPAAFGSAEKEKITTYISDNINRLSSVKSKTSYEVNDVKFDGPNRAIVSYSDSEYDISAVANVYLDKSGNVKVSSFSILEK